MLLTVPNGLPARLAALTALADVEAALPTDPAYADLVAQILEEGAKFAEEVIAPRRRFRETRVTPSVVARRSLPVWSTYSATMPTRSGPRA